MAYEFTELTNADFISRCQGMLTNRMQCTSGAKYLVKDTETGQVQQVCTRHKVIMEAGLTAAPVAAIPGTGTVQPIPLTQKDVKVQTENKTEPAKEKDNEPIGEKDGNNKSKSTTTGIS